MNDTQSEPPSHRCLSPRERRNQLTLAGITLLWALLFVGGMLLIKKGLLPTGPISWLAALVPSVAAVFVLLAYARFLRQADELQRLIQLQAMAFGFGGGFFVICGYALFEQLGAPEGGFDLIVVMPLLYVVATLVGQWRYR